MNVYLEKVSSLKTHEERIEELLNLSSADPFLGDIAFSKKRKDLVPILHEGHPVGFAIPRKDSDGRWRTGPIFVQKEHRGKGLGGGFIKDFFSDRPGRSYIDPNNKASISSFTSAGFSRTGKVLKDGDETLEEYRIR